MINAGTVSGPLSYNAVLSSLRGPFLAAFLFSALINTLMLTGSIYMLQVYDRVLPSGSVPTLLGLFAVVVLLYVFLALYDLLRQRMLGRAAMRLDLGLSPQAFLAWIGGTRDGQPGTAKPLRDIGTVRTMIASPAATALFDLPWVPLYLAILFLLHPLLGWLTVIGAVIGGILTLVTRRLSGRRLNRSSMAEADERDFLEQGRGGAEVIRAMGMTSSIATAWKRRHLAALEAQQSSGAVAETLGPISRSFRMLLQSAILTLGAYLVIQQELSAGMIVASSILSGRALAPIDQVTAQWAQIGRALEAHRSLRESLGTAGPEPRRIELPPPTGRLSVDAVTCYAPGRNGKDRARILTQVSFDLAPGDGLGVIGASASGKTTLARLLVGALPPDIGEVRMDGATHQQWPEQMAGRWIGYLPQQVRLLPGTIAENISRFDPAALDVEITQAARLAGVHDMILSLPEGYATRVGSGNDSLSGGQVQRLGLARAMFRMPRFVVLDEPNANLDAAGDNALAQAVGALRKAGSIVVLMSHRPSGLASVNKVLMLRDGRVGAFGDKDKVLEAVLVPPPRAPNPGELPAAARAAGVTAPAAPARTRPQPIPEGKRVVPPPELPGQGGARPATTAREKLSGTRLLRVVRLKTPERGSEVWPPLPPLPSDYPGPGAAEDKPGASRRLETAGPGPSGPARAEGG